MSEHPNQQTPREDPKPSYQPASPVKRALAWMGVVYMVILVLLTTYNLATGEPLHGIPGILLFPACGGLAAISWLKYRAERRPFLLLLGALSAVTCAAALVLGLISLAGALGG